jgi:hypothetical protein
MELQAKATTVVLGQVMEQQGTEVAVAGLQWRAQARQGLIIQVHLVQVVTELNG